jgi:hypothetical protein
MYDEAVMEGPTVQLEMFLNGKAWPPGLHLTLLPVKGAGAEEVTYYICAVKDFLPHRVLELATFRDASDAVQLMLCIDLFLAKALTLRLVVRMNVLLSPLFIQLRLFNNCVLLLSV